MLGLVFFIIIFLYTSTFRNKFFKISKQILLITLISLFGFFLPNSIIHKGTVINREFKAINRGNYLKIETTKGEKIFIKSKSMLYKSNIYRGNISINDNHSIGNYMGELLTVKKVKRRKFSFFEKQKYFYIKDRLSEMDNLTKQYFSSLIFGINKNVKKSKINLIRNLGVSHLFAISGMHIGIVIFILTLLISKLPISEQNKLFISLFLLIIYTFITSMSPSVIRSVIMFGFISTGNFMRFRYQDSLNSLFLAFLVIILADPILLFSPGFQLSFSATFGIIFIIYSFEEKFKGYNTIQNIFLISIIASIFTIPISSYHFGGFSPFAIISTIILSPLVSIFVITGILYLIFFSIPILNSYLLFTLSKLSLGIDYTIKFIDNILPIKIIIIPNSLQAYLFLVPIFIIIYSIYKYNSRTHSRYMY